MHPPARCRRSPAAQAERLAWHVARPCPPTSGVQIAWPHQQLYTPAGGGYSTTGGFASIRGEHALNYDCEASRLPIQEKMSRWVRPLDQITESAPDSEA